MSSAYSPVLLASTQVLDAAVQTINALHNESPFDFGISLGDAVNNTQYNELRWYIDVLDGEVITPCSGDHLGADTIDYQKQFQAAGLDSSIPGTRRSEIMINPGWALRVKMKKPSPHIYRTPLSTWMTARIHPRMQWIGPVFIWA